MKNTLFTKIIFPQYAYCYKPSFDMPNIFWFKYLPDRMKYHYAVINKYNNIYYIFFINENGQIFDYLPYKNFKVAKHLLRKNKFICSSNKKCPKPPIKTMYLDLMSGKKTAPYSKGNLWIPKERFKATVDKNFEEWKIFQKELWDSANSENKKKTGKNFYDLINNFDFPRFRNLRISAERNNTDVFFTINSAFGESSLLLVSDGINKLSSIWYFLDSVIKTGHRAYYFCTGKEYETFFFIKKYQNEIIHFIQLTKEPNSEYKVVQRLTLYQYIFIREFFNAINSAIRNGEYVLKNNCRYDDFIDLVKGSTIVKTYLEGSG